MHQSGSVHRYPAGQLTFFTIPFADFSPTAPYLPVGIDDRGDVDGQYTDPRGAIHGYLRSADGATWTKIDDPLAAETSGAGTVPESISPLGSVIVGYYLDSANMQHGFLYRDGAFTTYDVPGASATAVNFYHEGEFGGYYISTNGASHAFYVPDGTLQTIQAPGLPNPANGEGAALVAMSQDGTFFGDEFSQQPIFGFAYANGRYTTIRDPHQVGTTGADGTEVANANLNGVAVGNYTYTASTSTQPGYIPRLHRLPTTAGLACSRRRTGPRPRRGAHPRHRRLGGGHRLRPPQDDHPARRPSYLANAIDPANRRGQPQTQ